MDTRTTLSESQGSNERATVWKTITTHLKVTKDQLLARFRKKSRPMVEQQSEAVTIALESHFPSPPTYTTTSSSTETLGLQPEPSTFTLATSHPSSIDHRNWASSPSSTPPSGLFFESAPTPRTSTLPRRFALLIAITYIQTPEEYMEQTDDGDDGDVWGPLRWTYIDVLNLKKLLIESYGWREEEIVILCDHKDYSVRQQPTRECILEHLDKLVKLVQKGDFVFFHYSGHGYQTTASKDRWREFDGKDEYIVPMDWWKIRKEAATSGKGKGDDDRPEYILDNDLRSRFIERLPRCDVVALIDACHSATILDLPYESHGWEMREAEKGWRAWVARICPLAFLARVMRPLVGACRIQANVISICSCPDKGISFDSPNGGILVHSFCNKMREKGIMGANQGIKIRKLVKYLREESLERYLKAKERHGATVYWDEEWIAPSAEVAFSKSRLNFWRARICLNPRPRRITQAKP